MTEFLLGVITDRPFSYFDIFCIVMILEKYQETQNVKYFLLGIPVMLLSRLLDSFYSHMMEDYDGE